MSTYQDHINNTWCQKAFKLQDELKVLREQIATGDTVPRAEFEAVKHDRDRLMKIMAADGKVISTIYHDLRAYYGD